MKRNSYLLFVSLFLLIFLLLNGNFLSGLKTVIFYKKLDLIFWILVASLCISFLLAFNYFRAKGPTPSFKNISHAFLIVFTSQLVFTIAMAPLDIYRLCLGLISGFKGDGFLLISRNAYWVYFAFAMVLLTAGLFIYGMVKGKYAYRVIRHELYFDDLPDNFDGYTITQISDIHAGSFEKLKSVQKGIDMINAQKSDLFVFTGDLVNNSATEIEPYISLFSQIKAPFGQFSILGNHDYGDYVKWPSAAEKLRNFNQLKRYHQDLGFKLLLDEHVEFNIKDQKIILAGIENWGVGFGQRGDLKKALENTKVCDFKILLSHDPSHWDAEVKNNPSKIQLSLAGHTHGMQFGIEAFGLKWSPVKYRYKHWAGIKAENGKYLNVNRGFGFLGFSGRIGIWPEITVITLRRKNP